MAPRVACKCCNQLSVTHLMVTCCVCKEKYKHSCVDITTNEVRTLNSNKGYDWTCIDCRAIGKDLGDLKALIIQLQNDIKELKAGQSQTNISPQIDYEDIVSEITEREKRKNNIMLFNVPEPDQGKSLADQTMKDKNSVSGILNIIAPDLADTNVKTFRLGSFSNSKTRPLKVILHNENDVRTILRNTKKLKSKENYKNIGITSDRTKRQIEHYKLVREELSNRINSGETNCQIKYLNGVPRVVTLN